MNTTEIVNAILASRNATAAAFDRVLPEIKALDATVTRPVNVEVPTAVSRVLGATSKIFELRADILHDLPTVNMARLGKLEDYAYALQEAHVRCITAGKSPDDLQALGEEGDSLRALLRSDTLALENRGLIDGARLDPYSGQTGYKVIATDLGVLSSVLLSCWPKIQNKCSVSEEELHRAKAIADALLAYVGIRDQSPEAKAAAMDERDRAFTLLANCYDEARRAVTFLRWYQDDVEEIAPSLYGGKRRPQPKTDTPTAQPAPGTPAATTPATTSAATSATTPATSAPANTAPTGIKPLNVPVPGSNPFMS